MVGLALSVTMGMAAAEKKDQKKKVKVKDQIAALAPEYQAWLEAVDVLITKEEKRAFLELDEDYQRDSFIEHFWRTRDSYPQTARNEFKERWIVRVKEARDLFGDLTEDRSRIYLLQGKPDARVEIRCTDLWHAEVWYYQSQPGADTASLRSVSSELLLLFYQRGGSWYRLWYPGDGVEVLVRWPGGSIDSCRLSDTDVLRAAFRFAAGQGSAMGFDSLMARLFDTPDPPAGEWMSTFLAYSTDLPDDAASFEAELELGFPGRHKTRTVVQAVMSVSTTEAQASTLSEYGAYNFLLTGEVLREDSLFDNFRYQFNLSEADITGDRIPLVFERYLRPGDYTLLIKLEDLNSKKYFSSTQQISVPSVEKGEPPTPEDPETARILAEANAAISSGDTTLQIIEPRGELQTGLLRLDTLTTGTDIVTVEFFVDGRLLFTKKVPPFTVEIDLGSLPRMRTLEAVAKDQDGNEVARDQLSLNTGGNRFDVRLIEPRQGRRYSRSLRAEVEVQVPEDQAVERVEFYYNENLAATLYQPPFTQPILLPEIEELAYVRAVAYQPDGNFVEDSVFINAPDYMENLEIQFVELYITVLDKQKHPVEGLEMRDFTVLEDGVEQEPRRFDLVTNLPIRAGIMLDISGSMEESLGTAQRAALQFFDEAITPRDRAVLITFNDHPNLAVKFTSELKKLAGGLAGLKAERGTALYDSLIFSLYYFNGIKGQRTLIILSDGKDEHSRFSFENTLDYARRAGVAIYSIGLNLAGKHGEAKRKLTRLAEETGGRSFFIKTADELPSIYDTIQRELRSRYYVAYQSSNTAGDEDFRTIDVKVARSGMEAKTLRGYYP